jgi:hypothetical protein
MFYALVSIFCFLSLILTIAFGVLMGFHLYLLLWIRAGTYDWMMGGRSHYNERARARSQKEQYETAHRRKQQQQAGEGASGGDVREGRITDSGGIEFTRVRGGEQDKFSEDSFDVEHQSASGDDVSYSNSNIASGSGSGCDSERDRDSDSIASSRGTEELDDPELAPASQDDEVLS